MVTQRSWCDFFVYTRKGYHLEKIFPDKTLFETILGTLHDFFTSCLAPEILSRLKISISGADAIGCTDVRRWNSFTRPMAL